MNSIMNLLKALVYYYILWKVCTFVIKHLWRKSLLYKLHLIRRLHLQKVTKATFGIVHRLGNDTVKMIKSHKVKPEVKKPIKVIAKVEPQKVVNGPNVIDFNTARKYYRQK